MDEENPQNTIRLEGRMLQLIKPENGECCFRGNGTVEFLTKDGKKYIISGRIGLYDRFLNFIFDIDPTTHNVVRSVGFPTRVPFSANIMAEMLFNYSTEKLSKIGAVLTAQELLSPCRIKYGTGETVPTLFDKEFTSKAVRIAREKLNGGYDLEKVATLKEVTRMTMYTVYFYLEEYVTLTHAYPNKYESLRRMDPIRRNKLFTLFNKDPEAFCYKSCKQLKINPLGLLSVKKLIHRLEVMETPKEKIMKAVKYAMYYKNVLLDGWIERERNSDNSTIAKCTTRDWIELNANKESFNYMFKERQVMQTIWLPMSCKLACRMLENNISITKPKNPKENLNWERYSIERSTVLTAKLIAWILKKLLLGKNKMPPKEYREKQVMIASDEDEDLFELTKPLTAHIKEDKTMSKEQRTAVGMSCAGAPLLFVTGGPGTGKTSKVLLNIWKSRPQEYLILANAGVATDRVREVIQRSNPANDPRVETIAHVAKTLYHNPNSSYAYTTALIIDEASTVDLIMLLDVLKYMKHLQQLIMVGDVNQTSPIGKGYPFRDMMDVLPKCTVRLTTNFRAESSLHIENANCILNANKDLNKMSFLTMLPPDISDLQCVFLKDKGDVRQNAKEIVDYFRERLGLEHLKTQLQFITPYRKLCSQYRMAVKELIYGPEIGMLREGKISKGQRVIFRKGVKERKRDGMISDQVRNGETGVVTNIQDIGFEGDNKQVIDITNTKNRCPVGFSRWIEFETIGGQIKRVCVQLIGNTVYDASCITGHSSQGCEYETVVLVIPVYVDSRKHILNASLLYTMYTRAKNRVIIIYSEQENNITDGSCDSIMRSLGSFTKTARAKRPDINSYLWYELLKSCAEHQITVSPKLVES